MTTVLASFGTELVRLHAQWPPGLGRGAAGGLCYVLADFLVDYKDGFPAGQRWGLYLAQAAVRVVLGAVIGAATLAFGESAAFASGLAGPQALVALGAKFSRRKSRPGGKQALTDAGDRPGPSSEHDRVQSPPGS
jgi:hypothetical protein